MKRTICFCIAVIMSFSISACGSLFPVNSNNNNGNSDTKNMSSIRIVYPNSEETIEVENYEKKSITPVYIENKVLIGFYGQPNVGGYEYFNFKGEMSGTWKPDYPDTVYAIYEDIDYGLIYESNIGHYEQPASFYTAGFTVRFSQLPTNNLLYQTIYCNPNLDVTITVHADIKQHGKYASNTTLSFGMGQEAFKSENFASNPSSYSHISSSYIIKARQLLNSQLFVKFKWHDGSIDSYGLCKNIYYTISIDEN